MYAILAYLSDQQRISVQVSLQKVVGLKEEHTLLRQKSPHSHCPRNGQRWKADVGHIQGETGRKSETSPGGQKNGEGPTPPTVNLIKLFCINQRNVRFSLVFVCKLIEC
jgi:hypothetical protein